MERPTRVVSAAFVGLTGLLLAVVPLQAQSARVTHAGTQASLISGTISGMVSDDRGAGVPGAMVSALGATLASTVTDQHGRFTFTQLPHGEYFLRAHMSGFVASTGARIRVGLAPAVHTFELRRIDSAVGTTGIGVAPVKTRPIIAAGFALPAGTEETEEPEAAKSSDHPHTETAWRLRHIKRSILKDESSIMVLDEDDEDVVLPDSSLFGRAVGSAANLATSLFTDFPFSGEVNFLTTGAVSPGAVFGPTGFPRGVAYLALAAPGSGGDWAIRAAMSEGDLSSWLVAGSFASRPDSGPHSYSMGLAYSTQEYTGGNPAALAAVTDGSRNVGELYAFDKWAVSPSFAVEYGGRYAHYDYLSDPGQFSPRLGVVVEAAGGARVRAAVSQRMVAPGAEEFLGTSAPGPWLPPERTFAPLRGGGDPDAFRVERARSYDLTFEKDLSDLFVLGIGRFHQEVDDQLVTIFGLQQDAPRSAGHYYVSSAGSVDASGWVIRFDSRQDARIQGSLHYSMTRAKWSGHGDVDALAPVAPATLRPEVEDLHDLTSSFRADITETATRVFVVYKMNNGFVRNSALGRPGFDGRFEVQVNQALPVTFAGTRWEVLVGVRNLFRDPADAASVYDELLVVRPPKRVVGGFLVRF